MTRLRALPLFLATAILSAAAQGPHDTSADWAKAALAKSPRHGEYVTIKEPGGRALQAWVVYPEIKEKGPVVVMIHEIFGLSDWAREMADEVAGAGYIVVEPDLLSGFGPPASDRASGAMAAPNPHDHMTMSSPDPHDPMNRGPQSHGAAMIPMNPGGTAAFPDQSAVVRAVSALDPAQVNLDLDAAADYGKHLPSASGKLFVAGFCWGGGKSFAFATHRKDLSAAMVFYGPPPPADAMANITAPVYGFYAGNDARISATVPQTILDMKAAGKKYDPVIYDGAGHGFMRAGEAPDASAENAAARASAFRRFIDLLGGMH
jgi:carboxymethylenebutenolidase